MSWSLSLSGPVNRRRGGAEIFHFITSLFTDSIITDPMAMECYHILSVGYLPPPSAPYGLGVNHPLSFHAHLLCTTKF